MGEAYFKLKKKLEDLGYNNLLPLDAVPLVECVLADLVQTTRSLQHYMNLSKEALKQRDSLMLEAEPYKCDNAKLIQENNQLHSENINLREENLRLCRENKRKIKALSEELTRKDLLISKLQHDIRDLNLKGLCADTLSSRNKSRRKDGGDNISNRLCMCSEKQFGYYDTDEVKKKIQNLEEKNESYYDEITLLKNQIELRDSEIIRLQILLEGGRPLKAVSRDVCDSHSEGKVHDMLEKLKDMEKANDLLKKQIADGLEKQHEAMQRALDLADKNKLLHDELKKVDALALSVEEDCNKKLAAISNEMSFMQTKIENLSLKNSELTKELSKSSPKSLINLDKLQEDLNIALKEKDALKREISHLVDLNKSLQDKIISVTHSNTDRDFSSEGRKCPTKDELQILLEGERKKYEKCMATLQEKLTETTSMFNLHLTQCQNKGFSPWARTSDSAFVKDLNKRLCESQQEMLMLKKENEDIKARYAIQEEGNKQNYKDVITHLNAENADLSKENIALSQQLSQLKGLKYSSQYSMGEENTKRNISKLQDEVEKLRESIQTIKKDKEEYMSRYKEAMDLVDKLKRDVAYKCREIEQLQEENSSYKMTHRTGKASADHLREECNFLREQIKRMQSDVIKEKTLASQIKNIQMETERSNNEVQSELLSAQKKLSLTKEATDTLQRKCNDLQSEIASLKHDKSNLVENLKRLDQERDKLVLELDHKTENISVLEQKIKSQNYEINKLESEISELKRKLNINKISEHKIIDHEAQIKFLNGEILRLTQQFDNAIIENKHLQNSLADANGTLKLTKIEYDKSRKEVEGLKQQLQHYVAEIRRIEEMLSQKEAERSDMLEHFASLSVEANILENTNHSLESESASKSLQLQTYISKIEDLEERLLEKENTIDAQSSRIAAMTCRITALENEVKLVSEEKVILEQNVSYLKQMCNNLKSDHATATPGLLSTDSELKLYENKIKSLTNAKARLEVEKKEVKENLETSEKLLSNARREIVELKLALQDATSETKALQERINRLSRIETEIHESIVTQEELDLPLMLEETIHEVSHEEDEESSRFHEVHKRFSKYSHGSTL